jgi:hypothetical protein
MPAGTPKSYKLGPGTLTLGEIASPLEIACQITAATLEFETDAEDDVPTLCGGTLPGDETESGTLTGTLIQDLYAGGIGEYTWTNAGTVVPFTYMPNDELAAEFVGELKVRRMNIGGDVKTSPTADFEWPLVGIPTPTWATVTP